VTEKEESRVDVLRSQTASVFVSVNGFNNTNVMYFDGLIIWDKIIGGLVVSVFAIGPKVHVFKPG
jgi:hypothetical protein